MRALFGDELIAAREPDLERNRFSSARRRAGLRGNARRRPKGHSLVRTAADQARDDEQS
jgi:hypothetical protein